MKKCGFKHRQQSRSKMGAERQTRSFLLKHSQKWLKTTQVLKVIFVLVLVRAVQIASGPAASRSCGMPTGFSLGRREEGTEQVWVLCNLVNTSATGDERPCIKYNSLFSKLHWLRYVQKIFFLMEYRFIFIAKIILHMYMQVQIFFSKIYNFATTVLKLGLFP